MNKLVEYSDEEDEVAAVEAQDADDEMQQQQVSEAEEDVASAHTQRAKDIVDDLTSDRDANGRASSQSQNPEERSLLRLLGPPPKALHSQTKVQAESSNSGSKFESDHRPIVDSEWGLGVEKPSDKVDKELFKKLAHFHALKREQGTHFNQSLNRNRSFHNPHIYSKLVQWVEVEETGSGYVDMIRGGNGKEKADAIWPSSTEARHLLQLQGGKDVISSLQRKRQEESDERKKKARRDHLDFVGSSKPSSPAPTTTSSSRSEALAIAEQRARKIRDDLVAKRASGHDEGDRHRRREGDRDRDRDRSHYHHSSRRP